MIERIIEGSSDAISAYAKRTNLMKMIEETCSIQ